MAPWDDNASCQGDAWSTQHAWTHDGWEEEDHHEQTQQWWSPWEQTWVGPVAYEAPVPEPQSAAASSWEPMPAANAMPKLQEHEEDHRGNRRKGSGVKRLRLNDPDKGIRYGARGGGNSNPRVQWWCKRSAAEAQGRLAEFLRTNPKPPKKNDDSHGQGGGDNDRHDAQNKKKRGDEHDKDDKRGV